MLEFISFGSGSSGNCYYLSDGTDALFIDAGVGIRRLKRYFRDAALPQSTVRGLLITHDHADHIKSASYLASDFDVQVFATEAVHAGMQRNTNVAQKVNAARRVEIVPEQTFRLGTFEVTAFELPHDSNENMGYEIRCAGGEVFTVMTDVGAVTENVTRHIQRANFLVMETNYDPQMLTMGPYPEFLKERIRGGRGHMSNTLAANTLATYFHKNLYHVFLCHLSAENNHPELARKTVEMTMKEYGHEVGRDYQLDVLKRGMPTGPFYLQLPEDNADADAQQ